MLSFIVLFFASLISIVFFCFKGYNFSKTKKSKKKILKASLKRLKSLRLFNGFLFCFNSSTIFNFYKFLNGTVFVFNNPKEFFETKTLLNNCGIDLSLPIFKFEAYFDFTNKQMVEQFYKTLKQVKRVDNKNISFNFLVFYNNICTLKPLSKLIKHFNFKYVKTRLYNCCEIDYKLLSIINKLDVNKQNNWAEKNKQIFYNNKLNRNINNNMKVDNLNTKADQPIGLYLQKNSDNYYFDNFNYSNFYQSSFIEKNNFNATIFKTFNYKKNAEIFKLTIKNFTNTMQNFKVCFGIKLYANKYKNSFYTILQSNNKISILNNNLEDKTTSLIGNFKVKKVDDNYLYAFKVLRLKPFESVDFYFALSSLQTIVTNEIIFDIEKAFESNWKNYSGVKLQKVLTKNKTLNYLLNEFLPQKIIEQTILKAEITPDFLNLFNQTFDRANIDKSLFEKILKNNNFNLFFLIKNNLFKTYFNLFYFYLGVWQTKQGVYLNVDKSLIQDKSLVICQTEDNFFNLNITNTFNPQEVEVDKIKFSNLKMLNLNMFQNKKDISLVF